MTKQLYILLIFLFPTFVFSQNLEVVGGLIVDSIDLNSGLITNVADPVSAQDAATKAYIDLLEATITDLILNASYIGSVQDIEGNEYKTVKIGSQIWMAENLRTTKYNDGTTIPLVTVSADWAILTTPAYCWQNNDMAANADVYGALYNYFAVADTNQNVCPIGWHVSTEVDWTALTTYLGADPFTSSAEVAGGKMKEAGLAHWDTPNTGATNESGYTGLPGGYRHGDPATLVFPPLPPNGNFAHISISGRWWSSTAFNITHAWHRNIYYNYDSIGRSVLRKTYGLSVRCLKD